MNNIDFNGVTEEMVAAAAEHAAGSPELLRAVLDAAMPDLIDGIKAARRTAPTFGTSTINDMLFAAIEVHCGHRF